MEDIAKKALEKVQFNHQETSARRSDSNIEAVGPNSVLWEDEKFPDIGAAEQNMAEATTFPPEEFESSKNVTSDLGSFLII